MPIVYADRIGGATKSRVLADTQSKVMMNALAKQPFADFTAEQKRYKITLRVRAVAREARTFALATCYAARGLSKKSNDERER